MGRQFRPSEAGIPRHGRIYLCWPLPWRNKRSLQRCHGMRDGSFCHAGARRAGPSPCSVSGPQRYNTLDFAGKVVCQQGCCSPLLDDPEQRGCAPLEVPSAGMEARCCLMRAGGAHGICGCPLHPHMQKNREAWFADHGLSIYVAPGKDRLCH